MDAIISDDYALLPARHSVINDTGTAPPLQRYDRLSSPSSVVAQHRWIAQLPTTSICATDCDLVGPI